MFDKAKNELQRKMIARLEDENKELHEENSKLKLDLEILKKDTLEGKEKLENTIAEFREKADKMDEVVVELEKCKAEYREKIEELMKLKHEFKEKSEAAIAEIRGAVTK